MVNMNLINEAVKLAADMFEMENRTIHNKTLEKRILKWYNHTDITDAYELAAAAWLGDYTEDIDYDSIVMTKGVLFPTEPIEIQHFHIGEIEEALNDAEWQ